MDKLNALLIGFGNESDLLGLLDGSEETSYNFPANIPEFCRIARAGRCCSAPQRPAGMARRHRRQLAVGSRGENRHPRYRHRGSYRLQERHRADQSRPPPGESSAINGHGTAVASLIFSDNPLAPGIAPGATPLSVRIADDNGASSSFLIAQGIIAAVDAARSLSTFPSADPDRAASWKAPLPTRRRRVWWSSQRLETPAQRA